MNQYHNNTQSRIHELEYFITPEHACSYIPQKSSKMIFLDPKHKIDVVTLSELSRVGFRRSGDFLYRPECHQCRQCLSSRVVASDFQMNSQQQKTWKRNQDLTMHIVHAPQINEEHYRLYEKYICARHVDGDMYPPSREQFDLFLLKNAQTSFFVELRKENQLLSVSACDVLDDGISAIYTFFEPKEHRRSLGVFSILKQIEYVNSIERQYLYLGYWVPHSKKMSYKNQYLPCEILVDNMWQPLHRRLSSQEVNALGISLTTHFPSNWQALVYNKIESTK